MKRTFCILMSSLVVLMAVNTQAMTLTVGPSDDGFGTSGTNGNTVQAGGVGDSIWVRNAGTNFARKSWIRFDLSSYDVDLFDSATLQLQRAPVTSPTPSSSTIHVHGLNAGFVPGSGILGTNWSETALNWNNAPGNDLTPGSTLNTSETTQINTFSYVPTGGSGEGFEQYTITLGALAPYLQPDGSVTLILTGPGSGSSYMFLASKEAATLAGPLLTFSTVPPVPEPSTGLLLGLGSVAWLAFRSRRRSGNNRQRKQG